MNLPVLLSALLVATGAPAAAPPEEAPPVPAAVDVKAPSTLWLVQPLYPGQAALVTRTEEALSRLFAEAAAGTEIVGSAQLAKEKADRRVVIDCLFGDAACADPVASLVRAFGLQRVVLIKAGQDDRGYRFRVASFTPGSFDNAAAESANAALEKALLGALIKVAPLASSLELRTDPPGARVLVDGEPVGVTPLSTQLLPGERTIRIELASHHPVEWVEQVPVRSALSLERKLGQLPAKLVVSSAGATILVDGKEAGSGQAEVGVAPGQHRVQLVRDGYEPWETTVTLEAGEELRIDRDLQATGWTSFTDALSREQEAIYGRGSYYTVSYDRFTLTDDRLAAKHIGIGDTETDAASGRTGLWGISAEYGSLGRHFGLMVAGASYFASADTFTLGIANPDALAPATVRSQIQGGALRLLHPQLRVALWRFVLGAQGGFVGRLAHVETVEGAGYKKGFLLADLGLDLQGALQFYLVDGLYLQGAYRHSFTLAGSTDGTQEFRGGLGYAF